MSGHYLEDLYPGRIFTSPVHRLSDSEILRFAGEWDPQPFHTDHAAAEASFFGGLAASGWHTAAITMRLLILSDLKIAGGMIGTGVDELRWHRPVRPDDELRVEVEVLETRPMRSRPGRGLARIRVTTLDAGAQPVQSFLSNLVVPTRTATPA